MYLCRPLMPISESSRHERNDKFTNTCIKVERRVLRKTKEVVMKYINKLKTLKELCGG